MTAAPPQLPPAGLTVWRVCLNADTAAAALLQLVRAGEGGGAYRTGEGWWIVWTAGR